MKKAGFEAGVLWLSMVLAAGLWFVTFSLGGPSFWIKISISAAILAAVAVRERTILQNKLSFDRKAIIQGMVAAAALYVVFWAGREISTIVLPFAPARSVPSTARGRGSRRQ